jgi:hypothetical protein
MRSYTTKVRKEYVTNLRFDENSNFLTGEYEGRSLGCFVRVSRPRIVVDNGSEDKVFDLAEVIYAGIKALENCK